MTKATTSGRRAISVLSAGALAVSLVATALALTPTTAQAAITETLTVDSLVYGGDDADPGDGTCLTAGGICTLRAAIQESNALDAGPGDEVLIDFDDGLSGFIVGPSGNNTTNRMKTGVIESGYDHSGAYFHITARTRIDFGDDVGFVQYYDEGTAFYIDGPDVTIENFNASATNPLGTLGSRTSTGITGGETAFIVSGDGDGFTLRDGAIIESGNNRLERGLILQDGADDVTVENVRFDDFENLGGAIRVSNGGTVSNLLFDGITMDNTNPEAFYYGMQVASSVTLNNFVVTNSTFTDWQGDQIFYMNGSTINGGSFDNNTVDTVHRNRGRHLIDFQSATVSDFSISDNLFDKVGAERIIDFYDAVMTDVSITGNTFQNGVNDGTTNATSLNLIEGRYAEATNLTITDNTFTNVENVGSYEIFDFKYGEQTNMVVSNNTFTNVDVSGSLLDLRTTPVDGFEFNGNTFVAVDATDGFVDLRSSTSSDVEIANNDFQEISTTYPVIWTSQTSVDSSIHDNSWVNADDSKKVGWIFNFDTGGVPAATATGWTFRDNHIAVAPNNTRAPVQIESGLLPVVRNTFSAPARGTTPAEDGGADSETDDHHFVWNTSSNANGKFRTWYPNAVEIDGATERARVTVQPPALAETPHPATPVSVDVYYTPGAGGERQADVYLGRVTGLTAESTFDINCAGCAPGGFIRVQTITPSGATTQYSRIFESVAGTVPSAGLTIDVEDSDEIPVGSTVGGTGTAGNAVEVVNTNNGEVLCEAVVGAGGTWSCDVDFDATTGPATIVASESDPAENPVGSTAPVAATIVDAPVILAVTPGDDIGVGSTVSGSGTPGNTVELWDTGNNELLCSTTVQPDGTWSCEVPFDATQGPTTIQATDTDAELDSDEVIVDVVPAPVILDVGNDSEVPLGSTISGTGNPGTTVEVVNTDNGEVLCSAVVDGDGNWSCEVDEATTVGDGTLVANEIGGASSAPVPVSIVEAVVVPGAANDDEQNFVLDTPYTFDPLANDTDPEGASFDPASLRLLDGEGLPQTEVVVPGEGTYTVDTGTGEVTIEPESGFAGPTNPLTYVVSDTSGNEYQAQVVLTAAPVVGVSMFGPGALAGAALAAAAMAFAARRRRVTA